MAELVISGRGLQRLLNAPGGPIQRGITRAATKATSQAKLNITRGPRRVDDGVLRSSITYSIRVEPNKVVARVGTSVPYGRYVHDGTGIYGPAGRPIVPRRGKFLVFPAGPNTPPSAISKSGMVFARQVRGMKPNDYLVDALNRLTANDFRA